eukprot:1136843-Pelagomonas_calceolata.AAC.2
MDRIIVDGVSYMLYADDFSFTTHDLGGMQVTLPVNRLQAYAVRKEGLTVNTLNVLVDEHMNLKVFEEHAVQPYMAVQRRIKKRKDKGVPCASAALVSSGMRNEEMFKQRMLSASKIPMQDFLGNSRYRHHDDQKVRREADALSPQEVNRVKACDSLQQVALLNSAQSFLLQLTFVHEQV